MTPLALLPPGVAAAQSDVPSPLLSRSSSIAAGKRRTALFVAGSEDSEITDLIAPWAVLAESGLFDPCLVAASRAPVPITGRVFALPDFSFADAPPADLIVVPALVDAREPALQRWLRERAPHAELVPSVCVGAEAVAEAGLLDGRRATTHFFSIDSLGERYTRVRFAGGYRYVEDDPILSSAGVTAGIDAALYTVERFGNRAQALGVARRLGIAWHEESDPSAAAERPAATQLTTRDLLTIAANAARRLWRREVAVWLAPGASEIALAAALDARTLRSQIRPFTALPLDQPGVSAHGLRLLAPYDLRSVAGADLLVIPTGAPERPTSAAGAQQGIDALQGTERLDLRGLPPGRALEAILAAIEELDGQATATYVARMIEVPDPGSRQSRFDSVERSGFLKSRSQ